MAVMEPFRNVESMRCCSSPPTGSTASFAIVRLHSKSDPKESEHLPSPPPPWGEELEVGV
jgi:hypothetical protein